MQWKKELVNWEMYVSLESHFRKQHRDKENMKEK